MISRSWSRRSVGFASDEPFEKSASPPRHATVAWNLDPTTWLKDTAAESVTAETFHQPVSICATEVYGLLMVSEDDNSGVM
jgi:hypothetical protein